MKKFIFTLTFFSFTLLNAGAEQSYETQEHLQISEWSWAPLNAEETAVEIENYENLLSTLDSDIQIPSHNKYLSLQELEAMWVLGEKIYKVVEAGQPVLDIQTSTWSVLPKNISEAKHLTNWKTPVRVAYALKAKNLYGIEVINVRYIVQFVPGGKYKNKGAYLSHISVVPSTVEVSWGYTLNITAEAREALNVGTLKDPIAAFSVDVKVDVKTLLKRSVNTLTSFMTGDGKLLPAGFSSSEY
jgi:hypothetical protein